MIFCGKFLLFAQMCDCTFEGVPIVWGILKQLSARLMERYGADWTYDTLKRCRFFYQSYANASIGATPLPQLENQGEAPDSKQVADCGNAVATIQYFDFPFLQVPLAKLQEDEILQVALAPTIGLLLCPTKSNEKVRFSLRGFSQPMGVAEYEIKQLIEEVQSALPSIEDKA